MSGSDARYWSIILRITIRAVSWQSDGNMILAMPGATRVDPPL
jgi:hypothetical protein